MPDYSKIGKRSKRKGKTYERRCAKLLYEYTGIKFRSTPSSGGFNKHGGVSIREELFCGDLICESSNFKYCVEAKFREEFNFPSLIKKPETAAFTKWWYQCVQDAKHVKLEPMMMFKPNNRDDFVVFTEDEWNKYNKLCPHFKVNCYSNELVINIDGDILSTKLPNAVITEWKQFTSYNKFNLMFKKRKS